MLCSADRDPELYNTVWSRQKWQESSTLPNIASSRTPRRLTQHIVRLRPDEQQTTRCIYNPAWSLDFFLATKHLLEAGASVFLKKNYQ